MSRKKGFLQLPITEEFLQNVGGDYAVNLVKIWEKKKGNVTDEELAAELGVKITEIRTALNRLHYRGIACYQKSRNNKTGWYSYTWTVKTNRIAELVMERQAEEIQKITRRMETEKNYIYFGCKGGCITVPFEVATEYQFKCPECGKNLQEENTQKKVKQLNQRIEDIRKEVEVMEKSH
jgi:transcription initiation factor TFIIE subunit alpha